MTELAVPIIAYLWAGLSLGGSFIAAPAKFRAPSLTRSAALDVGRAQFFWLGIGEAAICVVFVALLFLAIPQNSTLTISPVTVFCIQRLVIMPILDRRTVKIISGEPVSSSSLHIVFVGLEFAKLVLLLIIGLPYLIAPTVA